MHVGPSDPYTTDIAVPVGYLPYPISTLPHSRLSLCVYSDSRGVYTIINRNRLRSKVVWWHDLVYAMLVLY